MGEVHLLPGTTFSSVAERGQYDSSKRALLTLTELEEWLTLQICGIYHRTRHHSTNITPMTAWEKAIHHRPSFIRVPQNPKQLYIDFLPFKSRKVRREGLRMFNIFYCSDALGTLLRTSSRSMAVHYDPRNLACVYVKDRQGEYLEIPYRNLSHPAITLEEYVRATRELQKAKHPREDEEARSRPSKHVGDWWRRPAQRPRRCAARLKGRHMRCSPLPNTVLPGFADRRNPRNRTKY